MEPTVTFPPLTIAETNLVINALIQRPYGEVKDLADKLIAIAKTQVAAQNSVVESEQP